MSKSGSKYLSNGLFIIFALIISTYILLEIFAPEKTIDILRYKSYIVVSSSMEPDIMVNDMILVHKVDEEEFKIGDAITFSVYISELQTESMVTHYIGDIQTDGDGDLIYKTLGATKEPGDYDIWKDASNNLIDITYEDIDGEVILVIPKVGIAVNIIKNPISIGLIIINGFVIYLFVKTVLMTKKDKSE